MYKIGDRVKFEDKFQKTFEIPHTYGIVVAKSKNNSFEYMIGILKLGIVPSTVMLSHTQLRQAIGTSNFYKIITKREYKHKVITLIPTEGKHLTSYSYKDIVFKQISYV